MYLVGDGDGGVFFLNVSDGSQLFRLGAPFKKLFLFMCLQLWPGKLG